ncbi:MAG TPA: hypothetical protein VLY63_28420, partial [Anaerolineae bacterium]|nr:hypothetical protein [Anaerolineae bacterium]
DLYDHCYDLSWQYPEGWSLVMGPPQVCIPAGGSHLESVDVYMGANPNNLPSGTTGEVILSAVEAERGEMSDSDSAWVTRRRPIATIDIHNPARYLRPGGDTAILEFVVLDEEGASVADGTEVQLATSLGKIVYEPLADLDALASSDTAMTKGGYFKATFLTGPIEGTAVISASVRGVLATTQIEIGTPLASRIRLEVADNHLPSDGSSTTQLTAVVADPWGTVVANQSVRIGVEGDGQMGTIEGGEVVQGTTDSNGEFSATYTSGTIPGLAGVRAELLVQEDFDHRVVDQDRQVIRLATRLYLPLVFRSN